MANLKGSAKAARSKGGTELPATLGLAAALPEHGQGKGTKRKHLKDQVDHLLLAGPGSLHLDAARATNYRVAYCCGPC